MRLVVEQGGLLGQSFVLEQSGPAGRDGVIIGRGGQMSGERIALPDRGVSRQHARIQYAAQGWVVTDLGSTNGTFVNGQRLGPQRPHFLAPGDRIALAEAVLAVHRADEMTAVPDAAAAPEYDVGPEEEDSVGPARRRPHPALLVGIAFFLVIVVVGIVVLLVVLLQPATELTTPTPPDPGEQIMTVVPTEFQPIATMILPLIPTELPIPFFGPTATPESARPGKRWAKAVPGSGQSDEGGGAAVLAPVPIPQPQPPPSGPGW